MDFSISAILGRFFTAVKEFVVSRAGVALLGLMLLVLLVWFGAPLIGWRGVGLRLAIIGGILAFALLVFSIRWWLNRRRARRLEQELNESAMLGTRPDRKTEIESLRKQMQDAIGALKASHLGGGGARSAALYALPWYMVIGPSGAGKSTILRNSSLNFPYSKHDPRGVQGVGGTRNCDWWFSDQAIFLDTAGRYTTEEDDRDEWYAFLDMLRKNRTAQPINGVLVAIAVADILMADSDAVAAHAKVVRERIDELIERLGILFPVYIVFTKCDLIRGFVPFFGDLGDEERGQVWGANVPVDLSRQEADHGDRFRDEFDGLHARLAAHRMGKLSLQRDVDSKVEILGFANQFMAARERLAEFVGQVFKKDPYRETPLFNGFYFTSGAQEGVPIERIVGSPVEAFGEVTNGAAAGASVAQRPYFIYHLLKDVVLPNSRQVVRNRRKEQRARNIKRAVIVFAILLMIVGAVGFSASYTGQLMLVARAAESSRELAQNLEARRATTDLPALVKASSAHYSGTGQLWAEDLHEGSIYSPAALDEPLQREFLSVMEPIFLEPVGHRLEQRLGDYLSGKLARPAVASSAGEGEEAAETVGRSATAQAYDALKMYIYLTSPEVTDPTPLVDSFVDVWAEALEQGGVAKDSLDPERMRVMVSYYLRAMRVPLGQPLHVRAWQADQNMVQRVRESINQVSPAERIYLELCEAGARKYEPVDLTTLLDDQPRGALVSKYRIPGIYTRKAWDGFAKNEISRLVGSGHGTEWVLGAQPADTRSDISAQAREQLVKQVRRMYFIDYSRHWFAMLSSISAHRFETLQDASMELQSLSREDGPIGALMQGVRKNIEVTDSGAGGGVFGGELVEELRIPFKHIRRLTREAASGDKDSWLTRYLDSLAGIQKDIAKIASSSDVGRDTRQFAGKLLNGEGESELHRSWLTVNNVVENMDARSAEVVANMLRAPMRNVWGTIVGVAQHDLDRIWKSEVIYAYNQGLSDRFPFSPDGRDAELNDVSDFFRAGSGTMPAFIDKELKPFLEQRGRSWESRRWLGIGMEFTPEFLGVIEKSQTLSNSMFRQGAAGMTFSVYPFPTAGLSESVVSVDGEDYRYRNGPQEWHPFPWPGQSPGARVRGVRTGSLHSAEVSAEGPWAWLRLLAMAETKSNPDGSFTATWKMRDSSGQSMNVSFKVRADSYNNPFGQGAVQGLRLPADIFRRTTSPASAALDGGPGRS